VVVLAVLGIALTLAVVTVQYRVLTWYQGSPPKGDR